MQSFFNLCNQVLSFCNKHGKELYFDVDKHTFEAIAEAVAGRRKDAVLNVRINSRDLKNIKQKARKLGIKYQTFISELLHRAAHS